MIFVSHAADGTEIRYTDTKRYLWIASILAPGIPALAAVILLSGGNPLWALFPLAFDFFAIPVFDWLAGEDHDNPPEEVVERLSRDNYYRLLLFLSIPVFYASFALSFIAVGTLALPWWAVLALVVGSGVSSGAGLTVGHELGHKPGRPDRLGAKVINALTGYAHFCMEHNRGHHVMVATPEDTASARLGENVYRFALREIPGAARRGWAMEAERLRRKGFAIWSVRNDLLQGYALSAIYAAALVAAFGLYMIPLLLLHHLAGWLQLTFANYVEHYGLMRKKLPDGRYEPCQPRHSWNTNHIVSNLMLFHLQRHSDHHANPLRPYQSLRNFDDLPRLPSGYPGSYVLAAIPPLWFAVMDPKVRKWAQDDIAAANADPAYRDHYAQAWA